MIGDGAITAGMAFEAMNHAGDIHNDMLVILNDNEMSISEKRRCSEQPSSSSSFWQSFTRQFVRVARKCYRAFRRLKTGPSYRRTSKRHGCPWHYV
ncbi:hypothetical protein O9929_08755 [Vibrio lentus]|nr:hypothetical protein [Vibrio lentus]